ncbi:MAG TPA: hypothetical protein VF192_02565 [Longimicrobiales bacterium]
MGKGFDRLPLPVRQRRGRPLPPRPAEKVQWTAAEPAPEREVVPARVRIEIVGGREATASALRAIRLLREIEQTGGVAAIAEVVPGRSALLAEVDGAQAASLARLPFVRRIHALN